MTTFVLAAMNLIAPSPALVQQLAAGMRTRREELQAVLHAANDASMADAASADVQDFKDVAAEDTRAQVDAVAQSLAASELEQIAAALRRVDAGTYGQCEDCGETIDERRLRALPWTRFCTACQALQERPGQQRR